MGHVGALIAIGVKTPHGGMTISRSDVVEDGERKKEKGCMVTPRYLAGRGFG